MQSTTQFYLTHKDFKHKERLILESGDFKVYSFRYSSGVEALRIKNRIADIIALPYQGQQIWSANFLGRDLTMRSMFSEPFSTNVFEANYGAFLIHCGATAMGDPGPEDTHPLHGELPYAPYQDAYLSVGEDEKGKYVAMSGQYQHTIAFNCNYVAEPTVKVYEHFPLLTVSMSIINMKRSSMELMYLTHINFRPVDYGRLVYSAQATPEHVRVRKYAPGLPVPDGYAELLNELEKNPEKHHIITPATIYDPEVVFFIDYLADEKGWAHTMQVLPDGSADYVRYQPSQLGKGLRWITRTKDQNALGMVLPATAESEGYHKEKSKGNIKTLQPNAEFYCEFEVGVLKPDAAKDMEQKIQQIVAQAA